MKNFTKKQLQKTLTILSILFCLNSFSQYGIEWSRNYGGTVYDKGEVIKKLNDGSGYISIGSSSSNDYNLNLNNGMVDFWIVKTDNTGNIVWEKSYGGTMVEKPVCVAQTIGGGYIVGGYTYSNNIDISSYYGNGDIWIIKVERK